MITREVLLGDDTVLMKRDRIKRICFIEDCKNQVDKLNMCRKHYLIQKERYNEE